MEIIKVCHKHGQLTITDCFVRTEKRWGVILNKSYSCKFCKKESSDKYRYKPDVKQKMKQRSINDRKKNHERILNTRRIYAKKNRDKINAQERVRRARNPEHQAELIRKKQKEWIDTLNDNYIKSTLSSKYKIPQKDVPSWMIEIKRAVIQLRRKMREMKNENN